MNNDEDAMEAAPAQGVVASSPLGRAVNYRDTYDPDLLFPVARQPKRDELGLTAASLPFAGVDVWNAYEISWLNPRGKPVVALGQFKVPADSPQLIESKSLKLYLNSYNQTTFATFDAVRTRIAADLSAASGATVEVDLVPVQDASARRFAHPSGVLLDELDIDCTVYQPDPALLRAGGEVVTEELLYSHLLKSNCLVTGQPDWGMLAVRYAGPQIDRAALLRYIVSFRGHDEFHEQCVERVFCDIQARCRPQRLAVWARYTRRGGLDINPFRTCGGFEMPENVFEARQ